MAKSIDLPSMEQQRSTSHLSGGNAAYVEALYETYLKDPNDIPPEWRDYFDRLPKVQTSTNNLRDLPHSVLRQQFARISKMRVRTEATRSQDSQATEYERKQVRVVQLISAYRQRGHQKAKLDPLALADRAPVADLELEFHELSEADLDTVFQVGSL
jgi:2-oxoglutarate dehydrogenase E1 component